MSRPSSSDQPHRRHLSSAHIIAVLALVVAIGGGSAYAAGTYLIHSKSQISPHLYKYFTGKQGKTGAAGPAGPAGSAGATGPVGGVGPAGPQGATGAQGAQGATGAQGSQGVQGPTAEVFNVTEDAGVTSATVGDIPVELGCQERNGNAPLTWIATTDTDFSSIDFLLDHSGSFAAQMTFSGADPGTAAEHGSFSTSSGTDLLGSEDLGNVNDYETGTIILNYNPPRFDLLEDTALNETVNFFLSVTGSGVTGTCSVMAEVVPT